MAEEIEMRGAESGLDDDMLVHLEESRVAWRRLVTRLRSVTPVGWLRFFLVLAAFGAALWLIRVAWLGLIPFILGAAVAYVFLPVVNWLDRFLPRWLASLGTMLFALALIVLFISQFIPFMIRQATFLASAAPSEEEMTNILEGMQSVIGDLPRPVATALSNWIENFPELLEERIATVTENALNHVVRALVGLLNAVGFIIGFLVVPTWLLTVLNEQRKGRQALNRLLPPGLQTDFWAIVKIIDRVLSTFVRGQLLIALLVGILTYLGMLVVEWLVQIDAQYLVVLAVFSGIMAFVPTIGSILGSLPIILLGTLVVSPETGLYLLIMYVLIWLVIGNFVDVEERVVGIHPALLIVIIVMVSELGFIWVLLAAPITAIIRDLFRYVYGRLKEPPRPAGLLPGEPLPPTPAVGEMATQPRIPLVYQHGRASRRSTMKIEHR